MGTSTKYIVRYWEKVDEECENIGEAEQRIKSLSKFPTLKDIEIIKVETREKKIK